MTTTERPLRVFLCHSSADKPTVRELYQKLSAESWIDPWLDEEKLFPGTAWKLEIEKAIEYTDAIIVFFSNNSITKEGYIQKEIRIALDYSEYKPESAIFIVPIRLDNCTPPNRFLQWQYADYFGESRERTLQRLLISLERRAIALNLKPRTASKKESYVNRSNKVHVLNEQSRNINRRKISDVGNKIKNFVSPFYPKISSPVKIGVLGPLGSGKTAYLTMLQYANCNDWVIKPHGDETQDLYMEYSKVLRDEKWFIPPTPPDAIRYLNFDFERHNNIWGKKSFHVIVPEITGEYFEYPQIYPRWQELDDMYKYQGLIWLIDPERMDHSDEESDNYRHMIYDWFSRFNMRQGGGPLKRRMAFCLTKMDIPKYSRFLGIPREYCLALLGPDFEVILNDYCDPKNIGFFSTSVIGFMNGTRKSNIDPENPHKIISSPEPLNLCNPFEWILSGYR